MKKNDNLVWLLVFISPMTFGIVIIVSIYLFITTYYGLNADEYAFFIIPIYFIYVFFWSKIFRKVSGHSWLD